MAAIATLPSHLSTFGLIGSGKESSWSILAVESVASEVMIRGFVAQVCAKLVYVNHVAETLQVRAVFPVDEGAAVYHCEAHLGGQTIVTHCMEKKKAEKMYSEAVEAGHQAVMTREHGDSSDILKLDLGNLPGESRAEITLKMVIELKVQTDGGISFVLPAVLNPRYCPPDHPTREVDQVVFKHIVHVPKLYNFEVKAAVSGSHKIARIISSTDPITTTLADDALSAQVSQDGGFKCDHDWSFVVYYNNPYAPHLLRETGDRSATGIMKDDLLMLNFFPEVPENTYSSQNEIIIIIDCSGSMRGSKIKNAKTTLLLFLKSLPPGCLFNVVSFGSFFSFLFPEGSRTYTEETLKIACNFQATMDANMGGTEILQPLQSIYSKSLIPDYSRQILLITDGEVWNVDQVLQLVGRHAHETRVFSVGVGHGASTALVHGVARAGRGRSERLTEESLLQQTVMGLVSSMVQENIKEVSIACELEPASSVRLVPKVPPVIFGGQHLILYARVPAITQVKSVTVRGQLGTKPLLNRVEGQQITTVHDESKSLHRLAARAQLLQWQLDEEEDVAENMVALSTASGVVCQRTALIGINVDSGKPVTVFHKEPSSSEWTSSFMQHYMMPTRGAAVPRQRSCKVYDSALVSVASTTGIFETVSNTGGVAPAVGRSMPHTDAPMQKLSVSAQKRMKRVPHKNHSFRRITPSTTLEKDKEFEGQNSLTEEILNSSFPAPKKELPSDLMGVVILQQFDGSWTLEDAAQLTNMPLDVLSASNPAKGEVAWATALVLVLLEMKFGKQKEQWTLLATKAQTFITGCGEQVEDLLAKARNTLHVK